MGEKTALAGVAAGITLYGVSLAELSEMATIFAGFTGGFASLAALVYYIVKTLRE